MKGRAGLLVAMDWRGVALVAVGGALGCAARYGVSALVLTRGFPWATLAVNLAGSFAIGALFLRGGLSDPARLLLVVGFLGGFTTLSSYSVETVNLVRAHRPQLALANLVANGIGGPLAAFLGWKLAA